VAAAAEAPAGDDVFTPTSTSQQQQQQGEGKGPDLSAMLPKYDQLPTGERLAKEACNACVQWIKCGLEHVMCILQSVVYVGSASAVTPVQCFIQLSFSCDAVQAVFCATDLQQCEAALEWHSGADCNPAHSLVQHMCIICVICVASVPLLVLVSF
jgi:hypothetical protein